MALQEEERWAGRSVEVEESSKLHKNLFSAFNLHSYVRKLKVCEKLFGCPNYSMLSRVLLSEKDILCPYISASELMTILEEKTAQVRNRKLLKVAA